MSVNEYIGSNIHFWEENYLNYAKKKTKFCMWQLHCFLKQNKQEQAIDPLLSP